MRPVIERFLEKINVVESGCWEWTFQLYDGYGKIKIKRSNSQAHRFIYEYYHGEIDSKLVIHHLCRNRKCVNVLHLQLVTNVENIKRGLTGKINHHNSKKTHCSKGHPFSDENTHHTKNGWRRCKICNLLHSKNQNERRKLQQL